MRMKIRSKLFLTLLTATGLVVAGMFLLIQWSFDRGFLNYVNTLEEQRLASLATTLETFYEERGTWDWLQADRRAWWRLLRENALASLTEEERRELHERFERWRAENPDRARRIPRPPPADGAPRGLRFENRVVLLDAERHPVVGPRELPDDLEFKALRHDSETVGYLGLVTQTKLSGLLQQRFAREQKQAFALISLGVVLVAGLLSIPLAATMVRRIGALAAGTHRLSSGDFSARVRDRGGDELSQLASDFNHLAETLEQNQQARRQWIADISHELRTPLSVLRGEIEALQDGVRPATPENLASLHAEILQLTRLVEDLYQLSLSDLGGLSYRKEPLDPVPLLNSVLQSYRSAFTERDLAFGADLPEPLGPVLCGDPERLRQLVENLIENCLRYTDPGGRVEIELREEGERLVIEFRDSAPGVAEAERPRLFERLYRVEGSRNRSTGGAGLGLSICRNIVAAHGGTITALPSRLGGLAMRVELPKGGR